MSWIQTIHRQMSARETDRFTLVATGFRTGSTLFGLLLAANGVRGADRERAAIYESGSPGPGPILDLIDMVGGRAAALKLMPGHRAALAAAAGIPDTPAGFTSLLRECRWIRLSRKDRIGQAISFWRASATGHWHDSDPEADAPTYDWPGLLKAYLHILDMEADWDRFLAGHTHTSLTYEDLVIDPRGALRQAMGWHDAAVFQPTRRQRDRQSQLIRDRFELDLSAYLATQPVAPVPDSLT